MLEYLKHIDTQLLLFVNGHNSPFIDSIMWQISGKWQWIPLYVALLSFIIYKYRKQSLFIVVGLVIAITISDQISSGLLKNMVERLRPSHEPSLETLLHIVNNYRGGSFGFVSSHAANSFALALFLSLLFRNRIFTCSIFVWAAVVAYSRIYLGVHYPGDVLGGIAVGMLSALFIYWVLAKFFLNKNRHASNQQ